MTTAEAPSIGWFDRIRTLPCAVLLAAQLLGIVVYPFTGGDLGRAVFSLFQLTVLVLAVAAVRMTPALTRVSITLGIPAAVLTVVEVFADKNDAVLLLSGVTHGAFYFYLAYGLIRYMFSDEHVSTDELFATGACFTVVAWAFAYVYGVVQVIWGSGQFLAPKNPGDLAWIELLFLSFTTMTGTGLSDIAPVGGHARSVVMLEQLAGVYYLALVVARLLGMTLTKFARK
ncbi:ion channel [Luteipulveratus mongoliensis]|uniref:Ion channel n=1 Tax=Luteipulveratus mongoliensis TaxID=571913 RepID=A0A0K1JKU3_9MICO|nr:ion channel [Luteipulveratus mongoliensis]AKU17331.1 Ion channel [Luteipulveratus mongoliensis]